MGDQRLNELVEQLRGGRIDRRTFLARAVAAGVSAGAIGAALTRGQLASAQDSTPSPTAGTLIGNPAIQHSTDTSKGTIKLYSSWPMIAASEQIGGDSREAVALALEDFGNAAGGFALVYEALDDAVPSTGSWDPGKESENANLVINDADAMVYIATYNSGAAQVSIPILNAANPPMAMISPANTYPGLTKSTEATEQGEPDIYYPSGVRNYMRVCPTDDVQGAAAANWAFNTLGAKSAYVLHDNQLYGRGVAQSFRDAFAAMGGEVMGFEGYDVNAPDYQALMTSIADTGAEVLYLGAIVNLNAGKVLADMRSVMPPDQVTFIGVDGLFNQAFIDAAGDAAEGAYVTFSGLPPAELQGPGDLWYNKMVERLGREPDAYAAYAYEAAVVAIQAIDQVGNKDRAAIREAMINTDGFVGLLGTWGFDENGDRSSATIGLNIVRDGAFTFEEEIVPAS